MTHRENLLIGVTGTIGSLTIPSYLHAIREKFSNIKIIMTEAAEGFIPRKSISLIVDSTQSSIHPNSKDEMTHVQLTQWADLFIVLPTTAHTIAQVAHGLAGNLLTLTILSHEYPVIFFPNMNKFMWENLATQQNVAKLIEYGHIIESPIERVSYEHANGAPNIGKHLPQPADVVNTLGKNLKNRKKLTEIREERCLITSN